MNEEKLISLKENFTGQKFQWVKTDRPELLGKVVRCRDVQPNRFGSFDVIFDDGSKIDSSKLNTNLMMIHGEVQPLTLSEVEAIRGPQPKKQVSQSIETNVKVNPIQSPPVTQPQTQEKVMTVSTPTQTVSKHNMFSIFNSEETQVTLTLKVKLPDKKLLKMMYTNAENKEKFLDELSEYLQSLINKQVISDSMKETLDPLPVKKKENKIGASQIVVREI